MDEEAELVLGSLTKKKGKDVKYKLWFESNIEPISSIRPIAEEMFPDRTITDEDLGRLLYMWRGANCDSRRLRRC